ncbi:AAEL012086-PA [Aedes aegypti]|uniref:AAEL012086-PA n=1 Tax=Aedes aegypti TaxID=7159 RepID=Q16N51_AEDAE|nr:AAEL012086-PA [Aedes aegypti]
MAKATMLHILWIWSVVGLANAEEMVNCFGNGQCNDFHAIVQGPQDVEAVIRTYSYSKKADFHGNLLTRFLPNVQKPTVQWEKLNISYNLLESDIFDQINSPKLKYVDITYNQLTTVTVPASVIEFIAERNKLTSITIKSTSLKRLILPKNKLDSFMGLNNLRLLQELDLSCNQLETLNINELSSMRDLKSLSLANNHISFIDGSTSQLSSLKYLDLSNNLLTMVDEAFKSFPNLNNLYLQNNKIVMWIKEMPISRTLQEVNIQNNDWYCSNLEMLKSKLGNTMVRGPEIACSPVESPYANRVIKYRKKKFNALMEGAAQRVGNITCDSFKPNPCDGDDNRVKEVAGSAISNAGDLAQSSVQLLQSDLAKHMNILRAIQDQIAEAQQINDQMTNENNDLANYIREQYNVAGLSGHIDPVVQFNKLFEHYESNNAKLRAEIRAEEQNNLDVLDEINVIDNEMEDKKYEESQLLEELNARNSTVIGYQKRIAQLQKQLSQQ